MRLANRHGRACIVIDEGFVDVATESEGLFSHNIDEVLGKLDAVIAWWEDNGHECDLEQVDSPATDPHLGAVVNQPRQVFAVGLNYRDHADEMGLNHPTTPMVFTKFASSLTGPWSDVPRVSERTDWEGELGVIIGRGGRDIPMEEAHSRIAGLCVAQDISDRQLQMTGNPAQFSLGKSWSNFGPTGPWITTLDEIDDVQKLRVTTRINGHIFQDGNTDDMVFTVAHIVSYLASVVELYPGDLIFTGSPAGVGQGLHPPRFLAVGDVITTQIEGLGTIRNVVVPQK